MTDLMTALITGGMTLLGVTLTIHHSKEMSKIQFESERQRYIISRKEDLYYKMLNRLDMPYYQTGLLFEYTNDDNMKDKEIEILLLLYAPLEIIGIYHAALEAHETSMPPEITCQRMDDLVKAIRNDLGIKRGESNKKVL